jgi:nitrogen regulatory protein A
MREKVTSIMQELERIRSLTFSDVVALARLENGGPRMRWISNCGHRNERYTQMIVKPGLGVAGMAVRFGRPFKLDNTVSHAEYITETLSGMNGMLAEY